jgi:hypothetical protein
VNPATGTKFGSVPEIAMDSTFNRDDADASSAAPTKFAGLAHLDSERVSTKHEARGSSPLSGTMFYARLVQWI